MATTDFVIINGYVLDVALSEEHTFEAQVTDYPVETGSTISDNIRVKPITVSIEGLVSSTPLAAVAAKRSDPVNSPDEAYRKLIAIRDARELVTITTSLDTYMNMALINLSIPRGPGGASFLKFTAKFQQVDFVTTDKTQPTVPTARKPTGKTASMLNTDIGNFKVIKLPDNSYYWFDGAIGAWRAAGARTQSGLWVFLRGIPYGFNSTSYRIQKPTNTQIKKAIATARKSMGVFAGDAFNPFDPHASLVNGAVTARDVFVVPGKLVDSVTWASLTVGGAPPQLTEGWHLINGDF